MRYLAYKSPFGISAKKLAASFRLRARKLHNLVRQQHIAVAWGAPSAPASALNGRITVNKLLQLQTWKTAELLTPEFSTSKRAGWLARSGTSFGGRDFLTTTAHSAAYWTKPIKNVKAEYRVHLCRLPGKRRGNPASYRVIRLGYKTNKSPSLNREVEGVQIRSRQFGWKLIYFSQQNFRSHLTSDLDLAARWAIATIGWDFCALDVLKTTDGKYVLLEANSAPGLRDDKTCEAYTEAIKAVLDAGV